MLVNMEPYGRLGNRLFLDLHLTAFSWKYGYQLRNLAIAPYAAEFPNIDPIPGFLEMSWFRILALMPSTRRFSYWGSHDLNFDEQKIPELQEPLSKGKTVFIHAWLFRGPQSVKQYRDKLLDKYRPRQEILDTCEGLVQSARFTAEVIVGVHVRWEDYRGTTNFLSQDEFKNRMEQTRKLLEPKTVKFIIFSNETVSNQGFESLEVVMAKGTPVEDLYTMAKCDFLLAPPSTFSGWASYYGGVPLATLKSGNQELTWDTFHVWEG